MKKLIAKNFRCYEEFEIDFRSGVNLIVGDNASGKTSLLRACKYALSGFFSGFSDENTSWIAPGKDDFRQVISGGNAMPTKPIELSFIMGDIPEIQSLKKNSKKNSKPLLSGIRQLRIMGRELLENLYNGDTRKNPLPVFAAFSTEDIHSKRKINGEKFKVYDPYNSFGYYECLNANGLLKYWVNRLLILTEAEKKTELGIVRKALLDALGQEGCDIITDYIIRPLKRGVFFVLSDGREVELELLSDGYKRLVSIVVDIAFRIAILNGNLYGLEACKLSNGTVLIDELDMHLHPSLQGGVLRALRRAFPRLQFIATTHSPMVMSGVTSDEENQVYLMRYCPNEKRYVYDTPDTYGQDSSLIIEHTLRLPSRYFIVEDKLKMLFSSIDNEDYKNATTLLAELHGEFGDRLPELQRASTIIRLMSGDYEED